MQQNWTPDNQYWTTPTLGSSAFPRQPQEGSGAEPKPHWTEAVEGARGGAEGLGLGVRYEGDAMSLGGEIYPAVGTYGPQGASSLSAGIPRFAASDAPNSFGGYSPFSMDWTPDQVPLHQVLRSPYPPLEGEIVFVPFLPTCATPATERTHSSALPAPIQLAHHAPIPSRPTCQSQLPYPPVPPPNLPPPARQRPQTAPSTFSPAPSLAPSTAFPSSTAPFILSRLTPPTLPTADPSPHLVPPCPGVRPPTPPYHVSLFNPLLPPKPLSSQDHSRPFPVTPLAHSFPSPTISLTELRRSLSPVEPFHRHLPLLPCRAESPTPAAALEHAEFAYALVPKVEEEWDVVVKGFAVGDPLREEIRRYLVAEDRLAMGERSVLILNPRLAQRSFGNEKRFLCPPPMALLLGASWWTNLPTSLPSSRANVSPEAFFSIATTTPTFPSIPSQHPLPHQFHQTRPTPSQPLEPATIDWMGPAGELCDSRKDKERVISGRAKAKKLFVRAPEEAEGVAIVEARVELEVVVPGKGKMEDRLLGKFAGKPLTVISRPSKNRQGPLSCTSLQHGTLVSLYNRVRSVDSTNRFLSISGLHASFPLTDWRATSPKAGVWPPLDVDAGSFVTRTDGGWDAFIIYAVDLSLPIKDPDVPSAPAPYPGYPRPPINAIPFDILNPKGIYYNQPVVLQCLSTAAVSPILIIRALDSNSHAAGGSSLSPPSFIDPTLPCPPREILGDPVSQFYPIALELVSDYQKEKDPFRPPPPNTFVACFGDEVLPKEGEGGRQYVDEPEERGESSEGRKVIKRRTSVPGFASPYGAPPGLRKRGKSVSNLSAGVAGVREKPRAWTIKCGDECLWSIVAVDVARTTFYIPPGIRKGLYTSGALPPPPSSVPLYSTPLPALPIEESPIVLEYETRSSDPATLFSILGENFSPSYHVWLGSTPCTTCVFKSSRRFLVSKPPNYALSMTKTPKSLPPGLRITLVRTDGVVFASNTFYREG